MQNPATRHAWHRRSRLPAREMADVRESTQRKALERSRPVCLRPKRRAILLAGGRSLGCRQPAPSGKFATLWEAARISVKSWHHAGRVRHGPWLCSVSECSVRVVGVGGCRIGRRWGGRTVDRIGVWERGRQTTSAGLVGCGVGGWGLWLRVLATVSSRRSTADPNSARTNSTWRLQTEGWVGERSRVDGRHPDARLVNLEEIGDQGVEVDVRIGKVVKRQFLPVPASRPLAKRPCCRYHTSLTFGTRRPESPC